jgi:hypothetical protein
VTLLALVRGESKELWGWEDGKEEREERERKEKLAEEAKKEKEQGGKESDVDEREEEVATAETTSIEIEGGKVLRSRAAHTA